MKFCAMVTDLELGRSTTEPNQDTTLRTGAGKTMVADEAPVGKYKTPCAPVPQVRLKNTTPVERTVSQTDAIATAHPCAPTAPAEMAPQPPSPDTLTAATPSLNANPAPPRLSKPTQAEPAPTSAPTWYAALSLLTAANRPPAATHAAEAEA